MFCWAHKRINEQGALVTAEYGRWWEHTKFAAALQTSGRVCADWGRERPAIFASEFCSVHA